MNAPPTDENARGNGQVTTGQNFQEHPKATLPNGIRNPKARTGQVMAAELVPAVIDDFIQAAGYYAAKRQLLAVEMLVTADERRLDPETPTDGKAAHL